MANYASTGKHKILDSVRQVVALHRERHVFPVRVQSGFGAERGEGCIVSMQG